MRLSRCNPLKRNQSSGNISNAMSDREQDQGPRVQRRLAAILSADAAGYSRLMADDDVATVRILSTCRTLVGKIVSSHHGRVVDSPGDNMLAEFGSAVDAVAAAAEVQVQLRECNANFPESRRMAFRIGVNLGDIVAENERIYGDGVNIAARIEALAEAGGICITGKVHDEVHRKLDFSFEDIGEHALKNIPLPIRVYRVRERGASEVKAGAAPATVTEAALKPSPAAAASSAAMATGRTKPSIIVLPFANMSGVAEQEFFVDGLTEDILTELSRFHELFVISRNTSMKYKGQAVDVRKVAGALNVQYVLEGSVRRAGNRLRITAQLIEAEADRHIWAERYDRELEDIFDLQDEMTRAIVSVLPGRVEASEHERAARKTTDNMAAYECVVTAKVLHHRSRREDNAEALRLITRAIELDPRYAHAHAWRACILGQSWVWGWCADRDETHAEVQRELAVALSLDDKDSDVHRVLAAVSLTRNELDKAVYHEERALNLNPNDDLIVVQQGELLTWLGRGEEGSEWVRKAMRLNPHHPERFWSHLGRALFGAKRYADAIESVQRISARNEQHLAMLAACHAMLGDAAAAESSVREAQARVPGMSLRQHVMPSLHYKQEGDFAHYRDALLKAGFPE